MVFPLIPLAMAVLPSIISAFTSNSGGGGNANNNASGGNSNNSQLPLGTIMGLVGSMASNSSTPLEHVAKPGVPAVGRGTTPVMTDGRVVMTQEHANTLTQMGRRMNQDIANQAQNRHAEQVGRAQVRRVNDTITPMLQDIRRSQQHRENQIQATAEHRRLMQEQAFQRDVIARLDALGRRVGVPQGRRY